MMTELRADDLAALVASARLHHQAPEDLRFARTCMVCYEDMPCTTIRLADVLAEEQKGHSIDIRAATEWLADLVVARAEAAALRTSLATMLQQVQDRDRELFDAWSELAALRPVVESAVAMGVEQRALAGRCEDWDDAALRAAERRFDTAIDAYLATLTPPEESARA